MTVFVDRLFREVIKVKRSHRMRPWFYRTGVLIRGSDTRDLSLHLCTEEKPCGDRARSCLQSKKRALTRNQPRWHLNLRLLALRTVKNKFLFFKPPSLWYFVMETRVDSYTQFPHLKSRDKTSPLHYAAIVRIHWRSARVVPACLVFLQHL